MPAASLRMAAWKRRLLADERGSAAVEFALAAPVFMMLVLGTFDVGHMVYTKAVLTGAVQEAARTSSLETGNTSDADDKVKEILGPVAPDAEFKSSRKNYVDFEDIGRPEKWNDANKNGTCDNREGYVDENASGQWEDDVGGAGNGGSGDVVLYKVEISFKPLFAIPFLESLGGERKLEATAVKKNQPFGNDSTYGTKAGTCT